MKRYIFLMAWVGLLSGACRERYGDDCNVRRTCPPDGGMGGEGGGGGLPVACVPNNNAEVVADSCGVFVSSSLGDDGDADGSKAKPYGSINAALAGLGDAKAVYLCGEDFNESVVLVAGVNMYGGLDCGNAAAPWQYDVTKRARLEGAPDQVALKVSGAGTSAVEDVDVRAPDALSAGGSSIAVLVDGVAVDFARCDFVAGDGVAGTNGEAAAAPEAQAVGGNAGGDACSSVGSVDGGLPIANRTCLMSIGGKGGDGLEVGNGGNGDNGQPNAVMNGGKGEGQPDALNGCTAGLGGDNGTSADPADPATALGTLTPTGYAAPAPADGAAGQPAQGGGGGGGSKGGTCTSNNMPGAAASGGSGGPGGCGGIGGKGGMGGGSSIALVSIDAAVNLLECNLVSGVAGNGGAGVNGQGGQEGGNGGMGGSKDPAPLTKAGCAGGKGGQGGNGGPGAGGLGGHSLGIAYVGDAPTHESGDNTPSSAGEGGISTGNNGNSGTSGQVQSFE